MLIARIQGCFESDKVFYSRHARCEMEEEELGEILDQEVCEAVLNGEVIESYPNDVPYPSCLIYGRTRRGRPIHAVCAYSEPDGLTIVITTYEPDPDKWIDLRRRKG
jgi:hypothetical protein